MSWPMYSSQPTFATSSVCHTKTIGDTVTKICSNIKHTDMIIQIHFCASTSNNCDIINKIVEYFHACSGFIFIMLELFTAATPRFYRNFLQIFLR